MAETHGANLSLETLVTGYNDLGFRLLSRLAKLDPHHNIFISPFGIATALAMVYNGAEGPTRRALGELLGLSGLPIGELNEASASIFSTYEHTDPQVELTTANSVWTRTGLQPDSGFVRRVRAHYAGEFASADFTDPGAAGIINRWVAEATGEKIRQLVTPSLIAAALLILINAVYFKGIWTVQFKKRKTRRGRFVCLDGSSRSQPMMSRSGTCDYCENAALQAVSLPYGNGRFSMHVFLPKPDVSWDKFRGDLTSENWQRWMSGFRAMGGDLTMPRFKAEYVVDALASLVALGGSAIAETDFLGMGTGPLAISNVIHKVFVEVNEEGTEAAAATAVVMTRGGAPRRFKMVVDHPFLCAIRDNQTGVLLFLGYVLDPTES